MRSYRYLVLVPQIMGVQLINPANPRILTIGLIADRLCRLQTVRVHPVLLKLFWIGSGLQGHVCEMLPNFLFRSYPGCLAAFEWTTTGPPLRSGPRPAT
jgi:hypothetical protein